MWIYGDNSCSGVVNPNCGSPVKLRNGFSCKHCLSLPRTPDHRRILVLIALRTQMLSEVAELIHAGSRMLMGVLTLSALALALLSPQIAAFSLRGSAERRLVGWLEKLADRGVLRVMIYTVLTFVAC